MLGKRKRQIEADDVGIMRAKIERLAESLDKGYWQQIKAKYDPLEQKALRSQDLNEVYDILQKKKENVERVLDDVLGVQTDYQNLRERLESLEKACPSLPPPPTSEQRINPYTIKNIDVLNKFHAMLVKRYNQIRNNCVNQVRNQQLTGIQKGPSPRKNKYTHWSQVVGPDREKYKSMKKQKLINLLKVFSTKINMSLEDIEKLSKNQACEIADQLYSNLKNREDKLLVQFICATQPLSTGEPKSRVQFETYNKQFLKEIWQKMTNTPAPNVKKQELCALIEEKYETLDDPSRKKVDLACVRYFKQYDYEFLANIWAKNIKEPTVANPSKKELCQLLQDRYPTLDDATKQKITRACRRELQTIS